MPPGHRDGHRGAHPGNLPARPQTQGVRDVQHHPRYHGHPDPPASGHPRRRGHRCPHRHRASAGSLYFGLKAGGGWIASAVLFAAAWPLWILSAAGLTRGSARARKIALGLASALLVFSVFKIVRFHESASDLIASVDLMLLACLMTASTRRFTTR